MNFFNIFVLFGSYLAYADYPNATDVSGYSSFVTSIMDLRKYAGPEERKEMNNVMISATLLLVYAIEGNIDEMCKMLSTYGFNEALRLQEVTEDTIPVLSKAMKALNDNHKAGLEALKKDCTISSMQKLLAANIATFMKAFKSPKS